MAETNVSVHSSHHTPPGQSSGGFFFSDSLRGYVGNNLVIFVNFSRLSDYLKQGWTRSCYGRICSKCYQPHKQGCSGMAVTEQVTDASFKSEVLESKVPVLVDFWAPWCGPCRMVAPVVDEIADQYESQIKVVKLNTDENPNIASQYGIRSIPTLMIFKGGQRVDMVVGAVPKTTLADTLEKYLDD